jgi:predicted phosphodiesterase
MRIRVLSDIHQEVWPFDPPRADADVLVLAGDIDNGAAGIEWAKRTFDLPVLYIAGNHEFYDADFSETLMAMRAAAAGSNIEFLDCGERVIGPVRFLGCMLWTDFSLVAEPEREMTIERSRRHNPDYSAIRWGERSFAPEDAVALCRRDRSWLEARLGERFDGPTVVITHFAPHSRSIAPAYTNHPANPGFIVPLDELMGRAAVWIHGHTHGCFDYEVRGTRVVCNSRGYPGENSGFAPARIIEIGASNRRDPGHA